MTDETNLDAPAAKEGARKLTSAGSTLGSAWRSAQAQINALNAEAPWGTDKNGQEFNKHYLEGGAESPAGLTLKAAGDLVDRLEKLGPDIQSAVDGTVDADDLTAKWFKGNKA